ncbi:MAG: ABC transporter substrate-binding protein [Anaerolineales bacterium]
MMKKTFLFLAALTILLSACEFRSNETVRIGILPYLQGNGDTIATSGTPSLNAARLAMDEINAAGGVLINGQHTKVELVVVPVENDPEKVKAGVSRLVRSEEVSAIIGPQYSGDAISAAEIAQASGIPLITGTATSPDVTKGRNFIFRIPFNDEFQGRALASFAYSDLQARRVAVMYASDDTYSSGLANYFIAAVEALGSRVIQVETFESGSVNIQPQIDRLLAAKPQLIFLPIYPADAILQVGLLTRGGYAGYLLGSDGWDSVTQSHLPAFNHTYASTAYSTKITYPENRQFVEKYQQIYGILPNDSAASAYDAMNLLLRAISYKNSAAPVDIQRGLYEMPVYNGVSGAIDFTDSGDPAKPVYILYFLDGDLYFFKAIKP